MSTSNPYDNNSAYSSPSADAAQAGGYPGNNAGYQQPYGAEQPYAAGNQQPYGAGQPYAAGYQQPYQQPGAFQAGYPDPNAAAYAQAAAMGRSPKSKVAAGVIALFIGTLGIHNFYLGRTGRGLAQLLLTVLSCGLLTLVTAPWAIVEGIMILVAEPGSTPWGVDAEGYPLAS
ncbi:TM2 domain [Actinomyces bovis]|uniref:TM2 domain n=1 Tax=Actinomyces bovis TaxID=1658 RepID=A0ABY1VNA1_9ACTO|nr:TM2 domain-containing protein [Actinomyces bovis]SPT53579.1 TM2 domain [Actinomyces bovis]VEG55580.1 TM2 domain [Actinomyces israelii]